jgi:hypothetical protein
MPTTWACAGACSEAARRCMGSSDECQLLHRELRPEKAFYSTWAGSPSEAEELLRWFMANPEDVWECGGMEG